MSRKTQTVVGIIAIAFVARVLFPIFSRGEPALLFVLLLFLGGGASCMECAP